MSTRTAIYLSLLVFSSFAAAAVAADQTPSENGSIREQVDCPIQKVYAVIDGEHRFLAYVVEWNGREVAVRDGFHARSHSMPADTLRVVVEKGKSRSNARHGYLSFSVPRPEPAGVSPLPAGMSVRDVINDPANGHGRFTAEVVRVYSTDADGYVSRAYVIAWKGEEVVAFDSLALTDHRAGDLIQVHFSKISVRAPGLNRYGTLNFEVVPTPRARDRN